MRLTLTIPLDLASEAERLAAGSSLADFARRALEDRVAHLRDEQLAKSLEEGYRSEAENPSLDADWAAFETEGL